MVTISLCMIVKNEEDVLARCLDSAAGIADEIVIIDTGSTDRTKAIAAKYTQKVYDFPWIDDFSAARNFSFAKATMDYCMWLDADDVLPEESQRQLTQLKRELAPDTDVVMMRYHVSFDENGKPLFSYYRERLIRRGTGLLWRGAIHETIAPEGKVYYSEAAVAHKKLRPSDPNRNLFIFEKMIQTGQPLTPREQFYYARELYYHARYAEAAEAFDSFLDSERGWVENNIDACRQRAYCLYALGREQEALQSLLDSFLYDSPRAETCCDIGKHYFDREDYKRAAFWYETALRCERNDQSGAFIQEDCYGFLPWLQLCVCYDRMGNPAKAQECNEQAASYKPENDAVQLNRRYFETISNPQP